MNAWDDDTLRTLEALSAASNPRQAAWQAACDRVAEQHAPMLRDARNGNEAPIVGYIAGLLQDQIDEAEDQAEFFPALQRYLDGLQAELRCRQVALRDAYAHLREIEADRDSTLEDLRAAADALAAAHAELDTVGPDMSDLPAVVVRRMRQERDRPALYEEIEAYAAMPVGQCPTQECFAEQLADSYIDWTYSSLLRMIQKRCGLHRAARQHDR